MDFLKKNKENIINCFFYIGFFTEIMIVLIDKSAYINPIEGTMFRITFLLFGLKVLFTRYSIKEWLVIIGFCLLGLLSYWFADRDEVLRIVMFVAASKNISLRKMMEVTFYTVLIGVAVLMLLAVMGILGTMTLDVDYGRGGIESRYCIGLGHPNALHCMIFTTVLLGMYLYLEKMKWYAFLLLFLGNIGLYTLTTSKTGLLIMTATVFTGVVIRYGKGVRDSRWFYRAGISVFIASVLFTLVMAKFGYTQGPFRGLDILLNNRISYAILWGGMYKWNLFGHPALVETDFFDMGLSRLFYWYGYIPATVYLLVNIAMLFYFYRKKDANAVMLTVILTVYTTVEAHIISVYLARNYILLLLIGTWSQIFHVADSREGYLWEVLHYRKFIGR